MTDIKSQAFFWLAGFLQDRDRFAARGRSVLAFSQNLRCLDMS
jgi:hypothetical protein